MRMTSTGHRSTATSSSASFQSFISIALLVLVAISGPLFTTTPAAATENPLTYSMVGIPDHPANVSHMAHLGMALDDATRRNGMLEIVASQQELAALTGMAMPFEVIIADLTAFYAERAAGESHLWAGDVREVGFDLGSMGGFYTNSEMIAKLDEMRTNYPHLITARQVFGGTLEDREIWMSKISDNPDVEEGEPAIIYISMTHAREAMGMATVVYYMFYLLENYGIDPEVTHLIDNRELYFVPILNPDGHAYNELHNPTGGGLWRKNRRNNGNGTFGVDPSRNYSYMWGYDNIGSSPNPGAQSYRGTAPFSEMETTAVRLFHQTRTIATAFHYHAFGDYEIHPFSYAPDTYPPAPDLAWFQLYGQDMSNLNGYQYGTAWQTLQYLANGEATDWSYGEQIEKNKVFAFAPEVGTNDDGFWPAPARIEPIAELNRGPNLYLAWIAGGHVADAQIMAGPEVPRGEYSDVVVALTNSGLAAADDVSVEVASTDSYVEDLINPPSFPTIPPQSSGDNQADPSSFLVSAAAPLGHIIDLDVTVRQGEVVMSQTTAQVTVTEGTVSIAAAAGSLAGQVAIVVQPNPFNPRTELAVEVDRGGLVRLAIYNMEGRLVRILVDEVRASGALRVIFDGRDDAGRELPSGVYVAQLTTAADDATTRLVLLR